MSNVLLSFFFFKQKPAYEMRISDWSSDACSSDLTREQHLRREKATSNICTAQVLLPVMSGMYAVWHGPKGTKRIAERVPYLTAYLQASLAELGVASVNKQFFDTLLLDTAGATQAVEIGRAHV